MYVHLTPLGKLHVAHDIMLLLNYFQDKVTMGDPMIYGLVELYFIEW
jgi:hypothetical protein